MDRLEAAVAARPGLTTLASILEALNQALQDSSAAVLKRAIPAAYVAFRCSLSSFKAYEYCACVTSVVDVCIAHDYLSNSYKKSKANT